jgi:superkiller protein 3
MELAEFYLRLGKFTEAEIHLKQIEEKLKSYPRLHYLLAKIALQQGDFEKAKDMGEKEKLYNPTSELASVVLGELSYKKKDYREAIANYEKALNLNPKSVDALIALGVIKLNQNHGSQALDLLMLASKYDKNNPEIAKQLGFAYKAAGQRSQAKDQFEIYLKLNPGAADRADIEQVMRAL